MKIDQKAYRFAFEKHRGQLDDDNKPYIFHPNQTANILKQLDVDDNLIAAAFLHDVVEDCGVTYEELVKEFNTDVADLVMEVTHEGKKDEHGRYFPRLRTQRGIMLKFADRLSNLSRLQNWDDKSKEQYLKRSKFWKSE